MNQTFLLGNSAVSAGMAYNQAVREGLIEAVKDLLENKHLYQSVEVDAEKIAKKLLPRVQAGFQGQVTRTAPTIRHLAWVVEELSLQDFLTARAQENVNKPILRWKPSDVKMFCKVCDRLEPFNNVMSSNYLTKHDLSSPGIFHGGQWNQVYVLSFMCQSCKSVPEVFLVRRTGSKLTLCGRAPMEHAPVPKSIPKEISKFYAGAVIAHQSGQTLAGLFMLRTACEQWAKRFADAGDRADAAIQKYMDTLPMDFKDRFPSIQKMYSELSAAIHAAEASDDLFVGTIADLETHFNARGLFKLPSSPADKSKDDASNAGQAA